MADQSYTTLARYGEFRYEEKRSEFIGEAAPCTTEEEALAFIARVKARFPDARHHVYAYLLRENAKNRYSDDHEPQGTAGMPVLDVIRKNGCTDTVVVVTRYFGGVLLGTGGLVRAYTAAAVGAIRQAGVVTYQMHSHISVSLSYADYNKLGAELSLGGARIKDTMFAEGVTLHVVIPKEEAEAYEKRLVEATSGRAVLSSLGESFEHGEEEDVL